VLIKHTPAAGSVFWSMYGHLDPASDIPFRVGDCVTSGTEFARTLANEEHHLHVELKNEPVEVNPTQVANACKAAARCWGYTDVPPANLGYSDPIRRVWSAVERPPSARFVAPNAASLTGSPNRNDYERDA
jgi:hypothetical protein